MQWIIEHINGSRGEEARSFIDDNDLKLVRALNDLNKPHLEIKQIPFTQTLLGMEQIDFHFPVVMYGSTQITEKVTNQYPMVSTFHKDEWWDPKNWIGKRDDLLNDKIQIITAKELRANWVKEPMFIKSLRVKAVTGMVLEPDKKDHDDWLIEHSDLNGGEELLLSAYSEDKIDREWRFFVVNGKLITGSTYRKDGYRSIKHPVSKEAWDAVEIAIKKWMPTQDVVIDLCRLRSGAYKVVEFNCLVCSGFYNSDLVKYVNAMEERASQLHTESMFGILSEEECEAVVKNLKIRGCCG